MKSVWGKIIGGILGGGAFAAVAYEVWDSKLEAPKSSLPATKGTKVDFINKMTAAIGNLIPAAGLKLAIAWAAFESNWGRTTGFLKANNPWNITAGSKWNGPTVPGPDTEIDVSGHSKNITQEWRQYATLTEGVKDMLAFLDQGNVNYQGALPLLFNGDLGFVDKLKAGGYFTLQLDKYKDGVQKALGEIP
jgi:flagellum-specific peptidoglycan hydrolase FlgJ